MNSHTRIQCTANITAIQQLDCSSYKILMYLACRSNQYGTCFPYGTTIAKDTGIDPKTVYIKLDELCTYGYIKYLRRAYHNRFTNESTPPLFQVSPFFLEIAEEFLADTLKLWSSENGIGENLLSNQQQESATANNSITQLQETTTTNSNRDSENESANRKPQKQQREQTNSVPQPKSESSAIVKNYTNPILITQPLPDLNEKIAESLSGIGIKIVMARGFVAQYGYDLCNLAYEHLRHLQTQQTIESPAGFYRYLLQSGLADFMPTMTRKKHITDDINIDDYMDS